MNKKEVIIISLPKLNGIIYSATNIINGKRYIGQTIRDLERRKQEHVWNAQNNGKYAFHQALNKYGEDNFTWEVLDMADTIEELDKKEIYWINYFDTYGHGGYNMAVGGQFNKSEFCDSEKISEQFGGKEFLVYDLRGNFIKSQVSQTVFANEIGVTVKSVNDHLNEREGKRSVGGYILIFKDSFNENRLSEKVKHLKTNKRSREFYVFNMDGYYIGKWNDRKQCGKDIEVSRRTITSNLNSYNANSRTNYLFYYPEDLPIEFKNKIEW